MTITPKPARAGLPWAKSLAAVDLERHDHKPGRWVTISRGIAACTCERCGDTFTLRVVCNRHGLAYLSLPKPDYCRPTPNTLTENGPGGASPPKPIRPTPSRRRRSALADLTTKPLNEAEVVTK